jgi:hypothetical protein
VVGIITTIAFLITGQLMRHHTPPMSMLGDSTRLLYRSRHIYILSSGLVNLMLGLYGYRFEAGWPRVVQSIGSGLLLLSPLLLTVAYVVEPAHGFREDFLWSALGLFALFGGSTLHLVSSLAVRKSPIGL